MIWELLWIVVYLLLASSLICPKMGTPSWISSLLLPFICLLKSIKVSPTIKSFNKIQLVLSSRLLSHSFIFHEENSSHGCCLMEDLPESSPFWPAEWISLTKSKSLLSSESVKTSSYNFNPLTTFTCQFSNTHLLLIAKTNPSFFTKKNAFEFGEKERTCHMPLHRLLCRETFRQLYLGTTSFTFFVVRAYTTVHQTGLHLLRSCQKKRDRKITISKRLDPKWQSPFQVPKKKKRQKSNALINWYLLDV